MQKRDDIGAGDIGAGDIGADHIGADDTGAHETRAAGKTQREKMTKHASHALPAHSSAPCWHW